MYELRAQKHTVDNQVYIELLYTDSKGEKHHVSNLILDLVVKDINSVIELKTIKGRKIVKNIIKLRDINGMNVLRGHI